MTGTDIVASEKVSLLTVLSELDDLLDKERACLLAGDLSGLSRILREKERIIDTLNSLLPESDPGLDALKDKALRNQALLDTAVEGIRAVANRVSALRRVRDTLETYDKSGRKTSFDAQPRGRVEKRA